MFADIDQLDETLDLIILGGYYGEGLLRRALKRQH